MSFGLIYLITNTINSKLYVGQTTIPLSQRWASHKFAGLNKPRHLISKAIGKYGPDNFTIEEICTAESREELDNLEKRCILLMDSTNLKTGYNMTRGGDGYMEFTAETREKMSRSHTGKKHTEESRRKISNSQKGKVIPQHVIDAVIKAQTGRPCSPELAEARSRRMTENNPFKGKKHTDETRARISAARKGKPTTLVTTDETREKLRIASTGKMHSEETKSKMRSNWTPERRDAAAKQRAAWWAAKRAAKAA